jgi:HEXXH motif-containing protein
MPCTQRHRWSIARQIARASRAGLALISAWPVVERQCAELVLALAPLTQGSATGSHGCTCGNFGDDWGWIYVTADSLWGFAEGIVHEMAHWKLRAMGIWFEHWTDLLLLNDPAERYESPVRKDMPRPMGAVLHGYYSYVHVAAMCVAMLKAAKAPTAGDVDWTEVQLSRIEEGQATVRAFARGTPGVGDEFLAGLDEWATRVLTEGREVVAQVVLQ